MLGKSQEVLQDFERATSFEWLETNGLGGWASTSIVGANTRRYHGLLIAATEPPTGRMALVSKLDETIVIDDSRYELGCNTYPGNTIYPKGHQYLTSFTKNLFPQWFFKVGDVVLKKTIIMLQGENTTLVIYDVVKAAFEFKLELQPFIAARSYHALMREGTALHWDAEFENGVFHNKADGDVDIFIQVPGSVYKHAPSWYRNFQYPVEQYRGLDFSEDLLNHGVFQVTLKEGASLGIIISTDHPGGKNAHELFEIETKRRLQLLANQPENEIVQQLFLAADQFIVRRAADLKTIIAGYHWFTDWGRDTMISLPGLCLSTGRFSDARKILSAFAEAVNRGMLPNRFTDNNEAPEYNNVDATLWFFIAVYKYLQATNDTVFVLNEILPVLKNIIDWHYKGTRYNIHVDTDGLLFAGEQGQQLTWMDARIGDWVVTPRMGKPVEIQALWYNALCIFSELLQLNDQLPDAIAMKKAATKVKEQFTQQFWFAEGNYLYDVIDENGNKDCSLRPNQLFTISLPFELTNDEKARAVLKVVREQLYTPVGLKSLSATDSNFVAIYAGDQYHRDSSYHQGTVWSWLLGAYVDALIKTEGATGKLQAQKIIDAFCYHLNEGCIGTVSEIFDAASPHHPRGCIAQAWGVAELLRVITAYDLIPLNQNILN